MRWRVLACLLVLNGCGGSSAGRQTTGPSPLPSPSAPHLTAATFLAFGDSLTEGYTSDSQGLRLEPSVSYPSRLQTLLGARFANQSVTVFNDGKAGETAAEGSRRLPGDLSLHPADVLLLLEGINDIHGSVGPSGIPPAIAALRTMIDDARRRGMQVVAGTLLPARPGALRPGTVALIPSFNAQMVPMAQGEGAIVVDLYSSLLSDMSYWIGPDGLHPTAAGYQEMADLFADAITRHFVVGSSPDADGGMIRARGSR